MTVINVGASIIFAHLKIIVLYIFVVIQYSDCHSHSYIDYFVYLGTIVLYIFAVQYSDCY